MSGYEILLADDHELFREGLSNVLDAQADFTVVGEASDGLEVLVKARELRPDLILMDICMPGCNGVEAAQRVMAEMPDVVIVMLTVRDEDEKLFEAIKNGAQGYLLKSIRSSELIAMLRSALRGEAAITPSLGGRILEEFRRLRSRSERLPQTSGEMVALTAREQEVLCLVAEGGSDQEIADALTISIHTVKSHMRNILSKLHLGRRHEAALFALREGLIEPSNGNGRFQRQLAQRE